MLALAARREGKIEDLTDEFVTLNSAETATPHKAAVETYRALQELQGELSSSLRGVLRNIAASFCPGPDLRNRARLKCAKRLDLGTRRVTRAWRLQS